MDHETTPYNLTDQDTASLMHILASIHDAVIITKTDGIIIIANPAAEIVTDIPSSEISGHNIKEALSLTCKKNIIS